MAPARTPLSVRFFRHVRKEPNGCWTWIGYISPTGYGKAPDSDGRSRQAHRVAWVLSGRALVEGLTLDHLCRNRACVNPLHLEQVTMRENMLRGIGLSAMNARKTVCQQGHPLDGVWPSNGFRYCRTCNRARVKAARQLNPEPARRRQREYGHRVRAKVRAGSLVRA